MMVIKLEGDEGQSVGDFLQHKNSKSRSEVFMTFVQRDLC